MAEAILFQVAGEILMKLSSQAFQRLGMLFGLKGDLNKLTTTVSTIKDVLLDAEGRQTKSHLLQNWLHKLEEALYDAEDVLDELSTEALRRELMTRDHKNAKQVRIFFSKSNQIAFNYRMARQIKNIWERLDAIDAEKTQFHLRENCESRTQYGSFDRIMMGRETWSSSNDEEVIGRDDDIKEVKERLLDMNMNVTHNVSFIAIAGMGGIGKTTLAKSLYNDEEVSGFFDLKIWVWVSDQFEVQVVAEKMIESATKNNPSVKGMEALQAKLQKVIGERKYLLVMDDVWNESEEKWHGLKSLLMGGARGSKVLITKRDRKVATEIKSMTSLFTLEGLSESNSWLLFSKVAFKEGKESTDPSTIHLGKEILVRCGGVPLVIRHVGRMLYSKTSQEEWMSFKDNELLEVIQQDNDMTSILKLSYNHLPPNLKRCFAYSSLFPKGYKIEIKDLIRQWVAQGFIEVSNGRKSLEDTGKDYFNELCWRFFYANSSDECNINDIVCMHDVMCEFVRKVAGNKLYVRGNPNNDYVVSEQTLHISFDYGIQSWQDVLSKLCKAKGLRTILLLFRPYEKMNKIDKAILDELFSSFPRLRVLDLHFSQISVVPKSIKKLRHLRYLDLSENDMELIPHSIIELQNLQTLNLTECYELKELPRDIDNLVNLRHLTFEPCMEVTPTSEGMEKLTCLQTISLFVFDCKKTNKLWELNDLSYLTGELKIIGLEKLRSSPSEITLINLKDKKGWQGLNLEWKLGKDEYEGEADETIMEGLEPHPNVESLSINGYTGGALPNWVFNSLMKLTEIEIENCPRVQHLPQFNQLQDLRALHLVGLRSLEFIDKSDPYSSSVFFPSLKFLRLEDMPNLEGWWELGESKVVARETSGKAKWLPPTFPQVNFLRIYGCPKLSSMPKLASIGADVILHDIGVQMVSTIGPVSSFMFLSMHGMTNLKYLWEEFQQDLVSSSTSTMSSPISLRYLTISGCPYLMSLPEWIGVLTSLETLHIKECPKLKSLPEGMQQLKSLKELHIEDCPELEDRCKQGGEDWPNISHVPNFTYKNASDIDTPQSSSAGAAIWGKMKDCFIR
ncbi:hypothetical protein Csa_016171 [Cucumis sativus]|nr:hypothetical protein Csa_016171 [Cucumis sativus]